MLTSQSWWFHVSNRERCVCACRWWMSVVGRVQFLHTRRWGFTLLATDRKLRNNTTRSTCRCCCRRRIGDDFIERLTGQFGGQQNLIGAWEIEKETGRDSTRLIESEMDPSSTQTRRDLGSIQIVVSGVGVVLTIGFLQKIYFYTPRNLVNQVEGTERQSWRHLTIRLASDTTKPF